MALQYTVVGGPALSPGTASIGLNIGGTDAKTVKDLEGWGVEYGGGAGAVFGIVGSVQQGIKGEYSSIADLFLSGMETTYTGGSGGAGITTPGAEAHGFITYTRTIAEWSVLDLPPSIVAIWYLENFHYYQ